VKPGPHYAAHVQRALRELLGLSLVGAAVFIAVIAVAFTL
jgi:hypothetical protein